MTGSMAAAVRALAICSAISGWEAWRARPALARLACWAADESEATEAFRSSRAARELFGDAFVDHYAMTREWEVRQFRKAVTDWELQRYFEII